MATKQDTLRDVVFKSTLRAELARPERRLHPARFDAASNGARELALPIRLRQEPRSRKRGV